MNKNITTCGWKRSLSERNSIDGDGNPIPWINYSSIYLLNDFLEKLNRPIDVFEYGAGNSTIWFSRNKNIKTVTSVDLSEKWIKYIQKKEKSKKIKLCKSRVEDFPYAIGGLNKTFDLIFIDGPFKTNRFLCAKESVKYISKDGIIILDNSTNPSCVDIMPMLEGFGFKSFTITGLIGQSENFVSTAFFYKQENIFNI